MKTVMIPSTPGEERAFVLEALCESIAERTEA
jgi:7,8-dihydro-6-hydroxymethylpterin-pyrophosphokinase